MSAPISSPTSRVHCHRQGEGTGSLLGFTSTFDPAVNSGEKDDANRAIACGCNASVRPEPELESACSSLSPEESSRKDAEKYADCTKAVVTSTPAAGAEVAPEPAPIPAAEPDTADLDCALASALARAAEAGRFDVVMQLARVLEGRRTPPSR